MRRASVLGAAGVALAAALLAALTLPTSAVPGAPAPAPDSPRITRMFIPAIKAECLVRSGLLGDVGFGYTFTDGGALQTIDQDGSLTGAPIYRLRRLNACLSQYPIEPSVELPDDHYSRNLLYEYFADELRPCLEEHAGVELPSLPARSDFVVRLYAWDPYRVVVPGRPLDDLLDLTAACPPFPRYLAPS